MTEAASPFSAPLIGHAEVARFCGSHVNLKREDAAEYRAQVNRLREKLDGFVGQNPSYGLLKMLLNGSLAKGLALKTLNDIDVALYLDANKVPNSNDELLSWLVAKLREAYPQMGAEQIQRSAHCVQITFSGTGLKVDVAPVWAIGDDDDHGYLLNRYTGQRVLTSIPRHIQFTRKRKLRQPDHYAQVVRLIKWWAKQKKDAPNSSFRMRSFMVEMVVAHLADHGEDFSDYPGALQAVFRYIVQSMLKERIFFTDYYAASSLPEPSGCAIEVFDPVNAENNVCSDYSDMDRRVLADAAEDALEAITEARFATTKSRAVACWKRVLGPSFRG